MSSLVAKFVNLSTVRDCGSNRGLDSIKTISCVQIRFAGNRLFILEKPDDIQATPKRRTHRRSASDTDVKKTDLSSFVKKAAVAGKIVKINEEDLVEGYEEGPSFHATHRVIMPHCLGFWCLSVCAILIFEATIDLRVQWSLYKGRIMSFNVYVNDKSIGPYVLTLDVKAGYLSSCILVGPPSQTAAAGQSFSPRQVEVGNIRSRHSRSSRC